MHPILTADNGDTSSNHFDEMSFDENSRLMSIKMQPCRNATGNQFFDQMRCATEIDLKAFNEEMVDGFRNPYYHNREESVRLKT